MGYTMPTMKIRGGDLDLVEYEFMAFTPGEEIRTCGFEGKITASPREGTFTAVAPARIHLTVFDMNRFAPGHPGGGGLGFALKLYCKAEVTCVPEGITVNHPRAAIIRHFLMAFTKAVGYTGGFSVTATDHGKEHVGLGSTSTLLTVVGHAANTAVGSPLSADQIRLLIGHNYVEETIGGEVVFGFETGVGPAVSTFGGIGVMGDALSLVYRHDFAEGKNVYIVIPPSGVSSAGEHEFDLLMTKARTLDYRDRELKVYLIMMDLIPAVERGDLKAIGDIMWEIEFRGSKRAEIEHHSFALYEYMSRLREAGLEFVAMSSVGPAIAIITDKTRREMEAIVTPLGLEIAVATEIDNEGVKVIPPA
jgi:beta-RFAP synthase